MVNDAFTERRLKKFIETFREQKGQLPTLPDLEKGGFESKVIDAAVAARAIEKFYVTLTNGTIMKGFKVTNAD